MCSHNQCLRAKKKNIIIFHQKINIFTAVKYCCILHGRVCVMSTLLLVLGVSFSSTLRKHFKGDF